MLSWRLSWKLEASPLDQWHGRAEWPLCWTLCCIVRLSHTAGRSETGPKVDIISWCAKLFSHTGSCLVYVLVLQELLSFVMCKMISLHCNRLHYRGKRLSYSLDLLHRTWKLSLSYFLWTHVSTLTRTQEHEPQKQDIITTIPLHIRIVYLNVSI